jgi:3-oxoacyl-[acyl-carrier protein] reductase
MMDPLDFSGKTVLVVGGSSGIGNAAAHAFRQRGATVYVWGTRERAESYANEEGSDLTGLHYQQMDVSDFDAIAGYAPPFPRLDVLVLSQGMVLYKRGEFRTTGFRQVIDVNLNSLMACAEKFYPQLRESQGNIVIVSSAAAVRATRGNPAYNASKTGALGLTRTLGQAWAHEGIRVNSLAPGMVETKMTKVTTEHPERLRERLEGIPMGRLGTVHEMADTVVFLASPMSTYITGQMIVADGGRTL